MTHKKLLQPKKICEHCQLSFCWRRKWARDWDNVKYCSVRCKYAAKASNSSIKNPDIENPGVKSTRPSNLCAAASVEGEF
jgi:hypothetical protein